jgi:hypothetical protein
MSNGEVNVSDPIIIGWLAKWGGPVISLGIVVGGMLVDVGGLDVSRSVIFMGVEGPKLRAEAARGVAVAGRFLPPLPGTLGLTCPPQQMFAAPRF